MREKKLNYKDKMITQNMRINKVLKSESIK